LSEIGEDDLAIDTVSEDNEDHGSDKFTKGLLEASSDSRPRVLWFRRVIGCYIESIYFVV